MITLVLSPRDGLFLKDGREWASAVAGRAHSLDWPAPSTLLGALCTVCGRSRESRRGRLLSPDEWLALRRNLSLGSSLALRRPLARSTAPWESSHRVWPVPADALFLSAMENGNAMLRRLDPKPGTNLASLGRDEHDTARETLWRPVPQDKAKPARPPAWWPDDAWVRWLADPKDTRDWGAPFTGLALPRHVQAHVGIDSATQAAHDEILFAHDVVETLDRTSGPGDRMIGEWAIGCQLDLPEDLSARHATIGGDRRLATITRANPTLFACPPGLLEAFARRPAGLRLIAAGPAAFAAGWLPDGFTAEGEIYRGRLPGIEEDLILRAALVSRAAHVSGWDMATRQAKPTTRLVPPGTVYHLVKATPGGIFTRQEAERLWLIPLGKRTEEGFGRFVPGIWHPTGSAP
ncbi:MAG: CRISPR-associated protein Cas5 [Acetobacteraceae bacterium]